MCLVTLERQMAKLKYNNKKRCSLCERKGTKWRGMGHNLDFSKYALMFRF